MECLNCGKEFTTSDNYCSSCGQNTSTTPMSTKHAIHQFFHAFTHTDKGFFYLMPKLLTRPGIISREYNEGKRKTYFSPFTFVLLIVAVSTLLVSNYSIMSIPNSANKVPEQQVATEWANRHFNIIVFFTIPLIAWFTSLFFKKKGLNFAESLVLVSYTSEERSIFFSILVIPIMLLFREQYYWILYTYLLGFFVYYGWACSQYLNDYRGKTIFKGAIAAVLSQVVVAIIITIYIVVNIILERSKRS